jgi:hypothetical protein
MHNRRAWDRFATLGGSEWRLGLTVDPSGSGAAMVGSRMPNAISSSARGLAKSDRGLALLGAMVLASAGALAADPSAVPNPATLGTPVQHLSPAASPPVKTPHIAPAKPANLAPAAAHAAAGPPKPLIPPAPMPVSLDPPPKPRTPLPLETDMQLLVLSGAASMAGGGANAKLPTD